METLSRFKHHTTAMTPHLFTQCISSLGLLVCTTPALRAMTAAELSQKLKAGEDIHLIDLRPKSRFEAGSIPGAMCIPGTIITEKKLPPLAPAVIFDDGLGGTEVTAIAAALNQRPGWKVEVLQGGFSAWIALSGAPQTSPAGLHAEQLHHITYENLAALKDDVVLVDLRPVDQQATGATSRAALGSKPSSSKAPDLVTDFCHKAPNRSYHRDLDDFRKRFHPNDKSTRKQPGAKPDQTTSATPPLVVLIGSGDADSRDSVRKLRAEGFTRVLVLAGGDEAMLLEGRRGKGRVAGSIGQGTPGDTSPQTKPTQP